ncbi:hypothetical protein [Deinococcus sp. GbtcB9]|uniref:hypothetical protein n=1 Tax=Deinococcus sp. GbtcB9 TaxID=2824754 RepID=UPI001C30D774|nr:hypothetical protein [Deinococcus sp. GbtcB9]
MTVPEWILETRPPTVSRERWHTLSTPQRHAAVRGYWRGLSLSTRQMLTLKGD